MKQKLGVITNIIVILFVGYALLRPAGPVGASVTRWKEENSRRKAVKESWTELAAAPQIITKTAPTVLVEFADYECRVCRQQHQMLKRLGNAPDLGALVVRHYPLSQYARSQGAALAALCADEQGRFPEMHDHLLSTESWITDANWVREAATVGVSDLKQFESCLANEKTAVRLERDIQMARRVGVTGTPAYAHQIEGLIVGSLQDTTFLRLAKSGMR